MVIIIIIIIPVYCPMEPLGYDRHPKVEIGGVSVRSTRLLPCNARLGKIRKIQRDNNINNLNGQLFLNLIPIDKFTWSEFTLCDCPTISFNCQVNNGEIP
jgi:hypothetical protein